LIGYGARVRIGDSSIMVVLLLENFCSQVVIGFLELNRYRWLMILADAFQRWTAVLCTQMGTVSHTRVLTHWYWVTFCF